jgi:hypothetical protein
VRTGRPDLVGEFRLLDPDVVRTFEFSDGRRVTGHFAFDPTTFQKVFPKDFNETRPGNVSRNAFRTRGFQQWDLRVSRPISVSEAMSVDFGVDIINVLNFKNWDAPFGNIDHPYFGIVRSEGLGRTFQATLRFIF